MERKEVLKRALKELVEARHNLRNGQKNGVPPEQMAALREKVEYRETVVEALRPMPHGEPLTLEQLREMDGKPVWVEMKIFHKLTGWAIVHVDSDMEEIRLWRKCGDWIQFAADEMEVYAYQPAHIDREAWGECESCFSCASCEYSSNPYWEFPCNKCSGGKREYYDPLNFCPECGRPLTEEGWAMLEKKLNGGG